MGASCQCRGEAALSHERLSKGDGIKCLPPERRLTSAGFRVQINTSAPRAAIGHREFSRPGSGGFVPGRGCARWNHITTPCRPGRGAKYVMLNSISSVPDIAGKGDYHGTFRLVRAFRVGDHTSHAALSHYAGLVRVGLGGPLALGGACASARLAGGYGLCFYRFVPRRKSMAARAGLLFAAGILLPSHCCARSRGCQAKSSLTGRRSCKCFLPHQPPGNSASPVRVSMAVSRWALVPPGGEG